MKDQEKNSRDVFSEEMCYNNSMGVGPMGKKSFKKMLLL